MKNRLILIQNTSLNETPKPKKDELFVTEYDPKFCKLLLEYAYTNMDIDGFYARYMILPDTSEKWEAEYPEWKNCVRMSPYKVKDALNSGMQFLSKVASGEHKVNKAEVNIDLIQSLLFRAQNTIIKLEKDMGDLRRKGIEKAKAAKNKPTSDKLNSDVSAMVEALKNYNISPVSDDGGDEDELLSNDEYTE